MMLLSVGSLPINSPIDYAADPDTVSNPEVSDVHPNVSCLFDDYYWYYRGYHVPEPTRQGKMWKPLRPSRHCFGKGRLGNTGDLSCLEHATEPSPPRSADGSSTADTPPSGFPAEEL